MKKYLSDYQQYSISSVSSMLNILFNIEIDKTSRASEFIKLLEVGIA